MLVWLRQIWPLRMKQNDVLIKLSLKLFIYSHFTYIYTCGRFRLGHLKLHATHLGLWVTKSFKQTCLSLHLTVSQFALSTNNKRRLWILSLKLTVFMVFSFFQSLRYAVCEFSFFTATFSTVYLTFDNFR